MRIKVPKKTKEEWVKRHDRKLDKELAYKYNIEILPPTPHSAWQKKFYDKELSAFQRRLGLVFTDETLLRSALIHHTFLQEIQGVDPEKLESDEDLQTADDIMKQLKCGLRDRAHAHYNQQALQLIGYTTATHVVKLCMYARYPLLTPHLCDTIVRGFLLSRTTVLALADALDVDDLLLTSAPLDEPERKEIETIQDIKDSEKSIVGTPRGEAISDGFFALIGAIKVDAGDAAVRAFLEDFVFTLIDYEDLSAHVPMTVPQAREQLRTILRMNRVSVADLDERIIEDFGKDSNMPVYRVGVFCSGKKIGEGTGSHLENLQSTDHRDPGTKLMNTHLRTDGARARAYQNSVFEILEGNTELDKFRPASL